MFFGLFRERDEPPHHRVFGWLWVEDVVRSGDAAWDDLAAIGHPHALAAHAANDAIWCGPGGRASAAHPELRLSVEGGPPSLWRVPPWIAQRGLSYHAKPSRWRAGNVLQSVARGQEFVADAGDDEDAHAWAHRLLALMA